MKTKREELIDFIMELSNDEADRLVKKLKSIALDTMLTVVKICDDCCGGDQHKSISCSSQGCPYYRLRTWYHK